MAKINVYLPDDLAASVKAANVPVSAICQLALERVLEDIAIAPHAELTAHGEWPKAGLLGRFTPRARQVLVDARTIAQEISDRELGTEHLLLGMLLDPGNLGYQALVALNIEPDDLRAELRASMGAPTGGGEGEVQWALTSKQVLEAALKEAISMRHNYVGCEHLLLGLVVSEDGLAGQVLRRMGVEAKAARRVVSSMLADIVRARRGDSVRSPEPAAEPAASAAPEPDALAEILRRLAAIEARLGE